MNARLFWGSIGVQAVAVAALFGLLLALPLDRDLFREWGFVIGPVSWALCSVVTAWVLKLPTSLVLFSAVAGGVAGAIVLLVTNHVFAMVAALLVFGAACGGYDPERDASGAGDGRSDTASAPRGA